eukprot:109938_1
MKEDTSNDNEDSANDSNHIITPMMERKTLALANSQATEHKNKIGVEIDPYPVQSMQPIVMPPIAMPMINNQCESGDSVTKSHDDDGLCDKQTASIDINLQALDAYDYRTVIHTKEDSKNGDEDMKEDSRNDNEDSTEDSTEYNIEGIDTLQALNDYHISYEQYADEAQRFPRCDDDTCVAFRRTFRNRADFQNEHTLRTIYGCEHNEECTCIAQYQLLDTIHCSLQHSHYSVEEKPDATPDATPKVSQRMLIALNQYTPVLNTINEKNTVSDAYDCYKSKMQDKYNQLYGVKKEEEKGTDENETMGERKQTALDSCCLFLFGWNFVYDDDDKLKKTTKIRDSNKVHVAQHYGSLKEEVTSKYMAMK